MSARGRRPPIEADEAGRAYTHVLAAGGKQDLGSVDPVVPGRLADVERRCSIEPLGQRGGKALRHVLNDQRAAAKRRGKPRQ
jgi:hypothetical protein